MSSLVAYGKMIKVSHTIFSMPFALASLLLAGRFAPVSVSQVIWIVLAVLTARSAAMGFNRIVDRDIDAANPRTANREIPSGALSVGSAWLWTIGSSLAFVVCSALLGPLTFALAPVALLIVLGYSLTKRFTALCHLVLGTALAIAPLAVWIAITGEVAWPAVLLSVAVGTWVAGFDMIYACQDADFDRDTGLRSVPSVLGVRFALILSGVLHLGTMTALVMLPFVLVLGPAYWVGIVLIGGVLIWEHSIVTPSDLSRINKAFFDLNGYISLVFLICIWFS